MLKTVTITSHVELPTPDLVLGIFDQSTSEYKVKSIEGLDPVKADLSLSSSASGYGSYLMGSGVNTRNIVITLGLNPDYSLGKTSSDLRQSLYRYVSPMAPVDITISSDEIEDVIISGYVETLEAPLFSKEPEVQISIICPTPYFNSLTAIEIDALSPNPITLHLDTYIPVGFEMSLTVKSSWQNFMLSKTVSPYTDFISLNRASTLPSPVNGDILSFGTAVRNRYVKYNGVTQGGYTKTIEWLTLYPGDNSFTLSNRSWYSKATLSYRKQYGGM